MHPDANLLDPGLAGTILASAKMPLAAFGLGLARALGLLQILPVATRLGLTGMHRAGIGAALTLVCLPLLLQQLHPADITGAHMLLLTVKEGVVGFVLGLLFAAPFWAAETAGELIDQQRGSRGAVSPDPISQEQSGITATLFVLTIITIFVVSGGFHWVIDAILQSYQIWPVSTLTPHFARAAAPHMLELLDAILRSGLILAGPMLIAMLLAELGLALVSRFAPQLNVFDLSMSLKGLVQVIGLPIYAVFLIGYFRDLLGPIVNMAPELRLLGGS
jgi:type III secretion protein T